MHSIVWFWTTGIHDPAWVQAFAAIALVGLTLVTLVVLYFYARDTHTLARASVEQINLVKQEQSLLTRRNYHIAADCLLKVQADLSAIQQSIVEGTFGTKQQSPIYPDNWTEVALTFSQHAPSSTEPAINLGFTLRHVDFAVRGFVNASNNDDKRICEAAVRATVSNAVDACKSLLGELPSLRNSGYPL